MPIKTELVEIFKSRSAGPFLFIGSGFSRRYLGLEDWKGLLTRFCVASQPFEYYLATANGHYPTVANLLAVDFNEYWWSAEEYKTSVERNKSRITNINSALRIEIGNYLSTLDQKVAKSSHYVNEVELLSALNVDGIITTNWDVFIEQLFPDYKVYIGQEELLFSNPQEIGEIYKIHGCSTRPESFILTKEDYEDFNQKNAYLAAKLITLFVEHPIIFIGYSLSDENISTLLRSISSCIGKNNIEQLRKNLIFVQQLNDGETENISDTYLTIEGIQVPLVLVKTNDFSQIYEAIDATKRKIPAKILRFCKEQLYELVQSAEPERKLCVVDIDDIEKKEDVEFLVGVGVATKARESEIVSQVGYAAITVPNLIDDLLHDNRKYDPQQIIEHVIPNNCRRTPNVPVFKYLKSVGIDSEEKYIASSLSLNKCVRREIKDYSAKNYVKAFFRYRHLTLSELIASCTPENAAIYIPMMKVDKIDLTLLRDFLVSNQNKVNFEVSNYASNFRKLASFYDRIKFGW